MRIEDIMAEELERYRWHPIATVPRDGHPVEVWCPNLGSDTAPLGMGEVATAKFWPGEFVCHVDIGEEGQHATHWRELVGPEE